MISHSRTPVSLAMVNSAGSNTIATISPAELRSKFLIEKLFEPGEAHLYYTDLDRLIIGGICPHEDVELVPFHELGAKTFHERRESGVINLGGRGIVLLDEREISLGPSECLYIGSGEHQVIFRSVTNPGQEPAVFYLLSCPAHRAFPAAKASPSDANIAEIGAVNGCSRRRLVQYIHEGGIRSCQLVMGFTEVPDGSAWNTMPPHVHSRRSEVYLYFDLADQVVIHLMGEPHCTRHMIVRDRQAVLSPPWSIHCGAGTGPYRFVWGMAGENQTFADMDSVAVNELY